MTEMSVPSLCCGVLVIILFYSFVTVGTFILFSVFKPPYLLVIHLHFKSLHMWNQPKICTEDFVYSEQS